MGGAASNNAGTATRNHRAHLITKLVESTALVHTYTNGFSGFAARLTEEQAQSIAQKPGVVSVFPDPILQLHTTRSWDFLDFFSGQHFDPKQKPSSPPHFAASATSSSSSTPQDTIIGFLDTGIWPESHSFNDFGMGPIPARWKGVCENGHDFNASLNCNRKIIGARYYSNTRNVTNGSPRDFFGHGTHVASTAAGSLVEGASYYGLALGTARGGSPASRIAMYQVCDESGGCYGSDILKAFDDAIKDGVDVLSLSLGRPAWAAPDFSTDPIAIGSFHAVEKGIIVVCSAGNSGPYPNTITNEAPWIFTVAASTVDRHFESDIILGGYNKAIKGQGIHFGKLKKKAVYPLVTGASARLKNASESDARQCFWNSLDPAKVEGKIVLCEYLPGEYGFSWAYLVLKDMKAIGVIEIVSEEDMSIAPNYKDFAGSSVSAEQAIDIFTYLTSTKKPVASILPTVTSIGYKPAPVVIYFSSKGPSLASTNLLKPDITAPGVNILAAWPDRTLGGHSPPVPGVKLPGYNIISGTSMACPHTSGTVANVKAHNPTFTISAIKSAIMTTATQTNNMNAPITNSSGLAATPYEFGAGQINPASALDPGLVYETDIEDYFMFLCATGYNTSQIRLISSKVPKHFKCPKNMSPDLISNINYPSIAVSKVMEGQTKTVTRTATNVGDEDSVYIATIEALTGIEVGVTPNKLVFGKERRKVSYNVSFTAVESLKEDVFGAITWTNGKYSVRSPIVVSVIDYSEN
ncbi:unnamed protein product [Cuscuta epithymum]|uniref:Uncharacterized protein n=1 Tax=Cuscuta epithymum TaxID=186058 RepID=A0AAV0CRB7_9ASTE|nr:unnamed protein product [Cuscuta epithymum]